MGRVSGKVALVTGGGSGIGRASAALLARQGAIAIAADLDEAAAQATANAIHDEGGQAKAMQQDVTDEARWREVVGEIVREFGHLDTLVACAGVASFGDVETTTLDEWRRVNAINSEAIFLGTQAAVAAMKRNDPPGGSIINISSIMGLVASNHPAYSASKGAVRLFTKSAALNCARAGYGVRVNSIHPGYIRTPMVEGLIEARQLDRDATLAELTSRHPIGRLGQPDDIANGVLYLASDESSFVTGSELVIDGGFTAQ